MREQIYRILLTSVGRRVELVQAFYGAAKNLNVSLEIVGADMSDTAPALMFCDKHLAVPRISDPDYIPVLLDYCRNHRVHALVPTIDTDLLLLSTERERFLEIGTQVWVADPEKIRLCRDKRLTGQYFRSLGLHAPETADSLEKYCSGFPAFIKPVDGSSSVGAFRADSMDALSYLASHQRGNYVIQPYVTGTEYTVDVFCDWYGDPIYITPRKRLAVRAGEVLKTEIHHEESIIQESRKLVCDFRPRGAITIQVIRDDATGTNHYIEINPRFGGGAPLSIRAGADSAEAFLRCLMGERLGYQSEAAISGAVYSRFDQSVCVHMGNKTVKAVIFDLDDTLYSEKEYVRSGYRAVAQAMPEIEDMESKLWQAFLAGKPAIDAVLKEAGLLDTAQKEKCLTEYRSHKPEIHLYDGVREMLETLRSQGIKLGILTDGRPEGQRNKLEALGLYELVDTVLITDELGGPQFRKPDDTAFRVIQKRLGVPFGRIVYVGDNGLKDFRAPKALGMRYLHFCNPDGIYYEGKRENQIGSVSKIMKAIMELIA